MQPLSGNQRPDLLTSPMNMSLVLRLPRKMHLCRSSSNVPHACHRFWKCYWATKPSRFAHFWQGAQPLAPVTQNLIWTSKSVPYPSVFYTFDFEMCVVPQRRALFRHRNDEKCSEREVFFAFSLANVLRATTGCTFSTWQLLKVLRSWSVLCIFWLGNVLRGITACNFSSLIWPNGSAPAALASLLFDPPEPQIIRKNTVFRDFPPFRAPWDFLFFDLLSSSLLWLFPSAFLSVHIVGSFTSKIFWTSFDHVWYCLIVSLNCLPFVQNISVTLVNPPDWIRLRTFYNILSLSERVYALLLHPKTYEDPKTRKLASSEDMTFPEDFGLASTLSCGCHDCIRLYPALSGSHDLSCALAAQSPAQHRSTTCSSDSATTPLILESFWPCQRNTRKSKQSHNTRMLKSFASSSQYANIHQERSGFTTLLQQNPLVAPHM